MKLERLSERIWVYPYEEKRPGEMPSGTLVRTSDGRNNQGAFEGEG